jgi:Ser/Thr protein kinase RdoA (MazF antagonist)
VSFLRSGAGGVKESETTGTNLGWLVAAADRFTSRCRVLDIRAYGNGNVHDTFLVTVASHREEHFILQRMNTRVFRDPALVMRNMGTVTDHVRRRLQHDPPGYCRRWQVPRVLLAEDEQDHWVDPGGSFWRAISFVEGARSFETIQDIQHAGEVGAALGMFHRLIHDLPSRELADTLPGFHVTPAYLLHYDEVLAQSDVPQSPEGDYCIEFVDRCRGFAPVLEDARAKGLLRLGPIHGDPKVNNVMIDTATRQAVGIVDLDTVKPGLVHYDIGDCLRSCCNPPGEETRQFDAVHFDPVLCRSILKGYLPLAGIFLSEADYDYLFDAVRLITFELGLRFFTDYLEGNVYFKADYREHNLARAIVQFRLAESIESMEGTLRTIIEELR